MSSLKNKAATALRIVVPLGILGWLFHQLVNDDPQSLEHLLQAKKNWQAMFFAATAYFAAVIITFVRWFILVRAIQIPFRIQDAMRLGFVGYLFQFVSLGAVGGDLFKAVFLYREQESRKPEAIATILIDRIVGLLGLLILASAVFFFFVDETAIEPFRLVGLVAIVCASAGIFAFFGLLYTSWDLGWIASRFAPKSNLRATILKLQMSLNLYRRSRSAVLGAVAMSVCSHGLQAVTLYFASKTLFAVGPSLINQAVMWSIAGSVAALPISPAGLGTFDLAYKVLYEQFTPTIAVANPGTLVAFLFRVLCLAVAGVGVAYYLSARRPPSPTTELADAQEETVAGPA